MVCGGATCGAAAAGGAAGEGVSKGAPVICPVMPFSLGRCTGAIENFVSAEDGHDFDEYLLKMEHFFALNGIVDDKRKCSGFITLAGKMCMKTLKAAIEPEAVGSKTYKQITDVLREKFSPKKSVTVEQLKFYGRNQNVEESILDLAAIANQKERDVSATKDNARESSTKLYREREKFQREGRENSSKRNEDQQRGAKRRNRSTIKCFRCGTWGNHIAADCKVGKMSRKERRGRDYKRHEKAVEDLEDDSSAESNLDSDRFMLETSSVEATPKETVSMVEKVSVGNLFLGAVANEKPEMITMKIENRKIPMEIDSGACVSVMHVDDYHKFFDDIPLSPLTINLKVVTGQVIDILGEVYVTAKSKSGKKSRVARVPLVIIAGQRKFAPLLGRNWLSVFFPDWRKAFQSCEVNAVGAVGQVETISRKMKKSVMKEYKDVFDVADCSPIKEFSAGIVLKPDATPVFHKPYTVPYGIRNDVHKELKRLVATGVLVPVQYSKWASPMVVVKKKNGNLRLCVDCKVTINNYVELAHYPLPRIDECFLSLTGCSVFCVLDLAGAYQQLTVAPESRELLTINTHWGLFQYTRLVYGLNSSPAIFQSTMERILEGIPQVTCYIDDILIGGKDAKECEEILRRVLDRLRQYNVKANKSKCSFFASEIEYLGHCLTKDGMKPLKSKLDVINCAKSPKNITELRSYLGLLNFYGRFIGNLSSRLSVLYSLLKKETPFVWTADHERVFIDSKSWLCEETLLTHYRSDLPLFISVDASGVGVGAVLAHKIEGEEMPIEFASSSLSKAERNYSIVEREALSLVFAVKKFHKYIYGREVTVFTDHSSLRELFGKLKRSNAVATARIARWSILLGMYNLRIVHRKGSQNGNADFLSRFPMETETGVEDDVINFCDILGDFPLSEEELQQASQADRVINELKQYIADGFPRNCSDTMRPFARAQNSLHVMNGIVYYGHRAVIPASLRKRVLELLHAGHEGMVRVKALARSCCWWPKIDHDIENIIRSCDVCQELAPRPRNLNLTPWEKSHKPFGRVHVDFFHLNGKTYFLLVDEYSQYIQVELMTNTGALSVIRVLRKCFTIFGLPEKLVSDNGPPFTSKLFCEFLRANNIEQLTSPPYHPPSNGLAERNVKTVKIALKKYLRDEKYKGTPIDFKLDNYVFRHNNTPSAEHGVSPMHRMLSYSPRTLLHVLNSKTEEVPVRHRKIEKARVVEGAEDRRSKKPFKKGEEVLYYTGQDWIRGTVESQASKVVYFVKIGSAIIKSHRDYLKKYHRRVFMPDVHEGFNSEESDQDDDQSSDDSFYSPMNSPIPVPRRSARLMAKPPVDYRE